MSSAVEDLVGLLGLAEATLPPFSRFRPWVAAIRRDLGALETVGPERVSWLVSAHAEARRTLPPLDPAVLLRRSEASARLVQARRASRRAARAARGLSNPDAAAYLVRLTDLLAVLARAVDVDTGVPVRLSPLEPLRTAV